MKKLGWKKFGEKEVLVRNWKRKSEGGHEKERRGNQISHTRISFGRFLP